MWCVSIHRASVRFVRTRFGVLKFGVRMANDVGLCDVSVRGDEKSAWRFKRGVCFVKRGMFFVNSNLRMIGRVLMRVDL